MRTLPFHALLVVFWLASSGCLLPTALGLRTDGRLPMHQGPVELGLGVGTAPYPNASPSITLHTEIVSVAATVHLLTADFQSVMPMFSGEGRIRVWEDGPEGMGVALLLGAGVPPGIPGIGVDTGLIVSSPRQRGFRAYGGMRLNAVFPLVDSVTVKASEPFLTEDREFEVGTHLFGTAAAGVAWSSPSGWTASLELMVFRLLARGNGGASEQTVFGLNLNVGRVLGASGR